jgi:hypothetical protein
MDEKRLEKISKKVKILVDEKQKSKIRVVALFSILEFANKEEENHVFQEHGEFVHNVLFERLFHQIEKIQRN